MGYRGVYREGYKDVWAAETVYCNEGLGHILFFKANGTHEAPVKRTAVPLFHASVGRLVGFSKLRGPT